MSDTRVLKVATSEDRVQRMRQKLAEPELLIQKAIEEEGEDVKFEQ